MSESKTRILPRYCREAISRRGEFDLHVIPHGPADDLAAEELHDGRQIKLAVPGWDIGVSASQIRFGAVAA